MVYNTQNRYFFYKFDKHTRKNLICLGKPSSQAITLVSKKGSCTNETINETAQEKTVLPVIPAVIEVIQLLCDEDTEIAPKRILNRITQNRNGYGFTLDELPDLEQVNKKR